MRYVILAACAASFSAAAACPQPEVKVCAAYFRSDSVFVGREVEHTDVFSPESEDEIVDSYRHRLSVERRFRGKPKAVETITSTNNSNRWTGHGRSEAVVFAVDGKVGDFCSSIDDTGKLAETVAQIEAVMSAKDSTIEGRVNSSDAGNSERKIEVIGRNNRRYSTVTDASGNFLLRVPPGRYRFATRDLAIFEPHNTGDLDHIEVKRGQCAQFLLEPKSSS